MTSLTRTEIINSITARLLPINDLGYIPTIRKGDTGVGATLEQKLGILENNNSSSDDELFELKAQRDGSTSKITLFCNEGDWKIDINNAIEKYASSTNKMYYTITKNPNKNGLYLFTNSDDTFAVKHETDGIIVEWKMQSIMETIKRKIERLLLVIANYKHENGTEMFHYNKAKLYSEIDINLVKNKIEQGIISIDIRLENKNNKIRNHGTCFRISSLKLEEIYNIKDDILLSAKEQENIVPIQNEVENIITSYKQKIDTVMLESEVLDYLRNNQGIAISKIAIGLNLDKKQISPILLKLSKNDLVYKTGKKRGTIWFANKITNEPRSD